MGVYCFTRVGSHVSFYLIFYFYFFFGFGAVALVRDRDLLASSFEMYYILLRYSNALLERLNTEAKRRHR